MCRVAQPATTCSLVAKPTLLLTYCTSPPFCSCQDGMIEDYYGHGRHAYKLIADLQESAAMQAFLGC